MASDFLDAETTRRLFGVTMLPRLLNAAEFTESVRQSYPPALRQQAIGGSILLSLAIDEQGQIQQVSPQQPPISAGLGVVAIAAGPGGAVHLRAPDTSPHPELVAAAVAAVRAARFAPAELDGQPRPFPDYRLTVAFAPETR